MNDTGRKTILNAMTVDVEDYFQVSAFENRIRRSQWDDCQCRVEANTHRILDLFAAHEVKATFFVLGWVAQRYPGLVRRIVEEGHELASHGYEHRRVTGQSPQQFREDVIRTKGLLEELGAVPVKGYRAASYSIGEKTLWALPILEEAGYRYSSSIYPIRHDLYGMPDAPRFAFRPEGTQTLVEVPISTVRLLGKNLPCGGGGYFRLFPYALSRWAMGRVNLRENRPCVFYFHPWEIDPDQPRLSGISLRTRIRHYLNLDRMAQRLERLLRDFRWGRMDRIYLDNAIEGRAG